MLFKGKCGVRILQPAQEHNINKERKTETSVGGRKGRDRGDRGREEKEGGWMKLNRVNGNIYK